MANKSILKNVFNVVFGQAIQHCMYLKKRIVIWLSLYFVIKILIIKVTK